jgi:cell division protein FtsQ
MQQGVPPGGRSLPGMQLEATDAEGDDLPRLRGPSQDWSGAEVPSRPWWRPASTVGRVFLGLCLFIVLGGLTTSGFLLKSYLNRDARFRIAGAGNIEASGLTEVTRAEMLPVFGEDIGRNIFFVPLAERRRQLEEIPWIEHATVMRLLPDQIHVAVVERQPVAFVRQGQQIGLVDASGVLLTMPAPLMARHHYSFPVVTGIDPADPAPARKARMGVYERLLAELDSNGQHLSDQISEIDLTDPEDARVLMPEPGNDILAHFGEERFLERYQRYKKHIAEWRQQYPKLASVDLRYDSQVVLEMSPGAGASESVAAEPSAAKPDEAANAAPGASKPSPGQPIQPTNAQSAVKPPLAADASSATTAPVSKTAVAATKSKGKTSARPKMTVAQMAAQMKKRRAEAQRAALLKQKSASKPHPASAGQGQ